MYGRGFQYFRPCPFDELTPVKNILSINADTCIVFYIDTSLAVFKLPTLELLGSIQKNWMTNSTEFDDVEITCIHVDDFTERNLKTFVFVGTNLGDIHVLEISTVGTIRICDYSVSSRDVELSCPMRVTSILSVIFVISFPVLSFPFSFVLEEYPFK